MADETTVTSGTLAASVNRRFIQSADPTPKARLLVGAASLALAANLPLDPARAQDKWDPWVGAAGLFGDGEQQGKLDIFVPLVQDATSMFFLDAQGRYDSEDSKQGSIGLGVRTIVDGSWILGFNGFFDVFDSQYDNMFYQGGAGVEALWNDFEIRANGHFPGGGPEPVDALGPNLVLEGNRIGLEMFNERALPGFDGEVGFKLPIFDGDPDFEIRLFGGGYYYWGEGNIDDVAGPKGRIEARIYDIGFLTNGSRLVLGGEVRHDDVNGTEGFGSVLVRIPLSSAPAGGQKLTGLDRRMLDRIEREKVFTNVGYYVEDVFVNNGDATVDTIFWSEPGAGGDGTYDDPSNVYHALKYAGPNSIVVIDGGTYQTGGINLYQGQNLVGAGKGVLLTGVETYSQILFTPKPFGATPTISGTNAGNDLITFSTDTSIVELNLTGDFFDGIRGPHVISNFWIEDNDIDLTGAFGAGIRVHVYNPFNVNRPITPSGVITWNNVHTAGIDDGIETYLKVNDGGSHAWDFVATWNRVDDVVGHGIEFESHTYNLGSSLKLSVDVSHNSITGTVSDAMEIHTHASAGGFVDAYDPVIVDDNTISAVEDGDGIELRVQADNGGTIRHSASISDNTVTDASGFGIYVDDDIRSGSTLTQTADIAGNSIYNTGEGGVRLEAKVDDAMATQSVSIDDNSIDDVGNDGIAVRTFVYNGAFVDQEGTINIRGNMVRDTGRSGINVHSRAFDSTLYQTANLEDNRIGVDGAKTIGLNGIELSGDVRGAAAAATLRQEANIDGNWVLGVERHGIYVQSRARNQGFLDQADTVTSHGNTVYNIAGDGIIIDTRAQDAGTTVLQTTGIAYNVVGDPTVDDDIGGTGIHVNTRAVGGAVIDQGNTIDVNGNMVRQTALDGIGIANYVAGGSTLYQTANVDDNMVGIAGATTIGGDGIDISTTVKNAGSHLNQEAGIYDNTVRYVTGKGISIYTEAADYAIVDQANTIILDGNSVSHAGDDGIYVKSFARDVGTLMQGLTVTDNSVGSSGDDGIDVQFEIFGNDSRTRITGIAITSYNTAVDNADYGIVLSRTINAIYDGTIAQYLCIESNILTGNGNDFVNVFTTPLGGYINNKINISPPCP